MASAKRATFNEKHHLAYLSRGLRHALFSRKTLFGRTYTYPFALLIAHSLFTFAFADNTSAGSACIIIISLYFASFFAIAFANNSRSSRIIGSYTLHICSNAFLRSYLLQSNFRSRAELVA